MTAGPARRPNPRQDALNAEMRSAMADDGILDVYIDVDGEMRGNGQHMNQWNVETIKAGLTWFDEVTGIPIRFVETEAESELSIHKLKDAPGEGFEKWNPMWGQVKGLVHNKGNQDLNMYFEGGNGSLGATNHIIYHELAHIFGAYELEQPYAYSSDQTVMGYGYNQITGFTGFSASDFEYFDSIY